MQESLEQHTADLIARRVPFARALVVRAQQPTSARPGDVAVVTADGTMTGFVGGQCAAETVRLAAVEAIGSGEPVLLRILPGDDPAHFPETAGARVSVNTCLSGGAVEVFVEPVLPASIVLISGSTPVARAVTAQARLLGFEVRTTGADEVGGEDGGPEGALAVIVAAHGDGTEPATIRAALDAGVPIIELVASHRRGNAMMDSLGLTEAERAVVRTPAGLPIGAMTPAEIALSIMAQVITEIRQDAVLSAAAEREPEAPRQEVDPICGMTVVVTQSTPTLTVDGTQHWFCCTGCRDQFAAAHAPAGHGSHE